MATFSAARAPVQQIRHDPTDLRFCREALPRVSRTFAINIRLLTGTLGEAFLDWTA